MFEKRVVEQSRRIEVVGFNHAELATNPGRLTNAWNTNKQVTNLNDIGILMIFVDKCKSPPKEDLEKKMTLEHRFVL